MFLPEQIEALNEAMTYLQDMRFKAPVRSEKKLAMGITENKYEMKKFQWGYLILINATIQIQDELKIVFNVPTLLTYLTTQAQCLKISHKVAMQSKHCIFQFWHFPSIFVLFKTDLSGYTF